ncbi:calmodulin-like protein 7 [Dioscorea cayenensis subsp. rotundata]|uniref:Calmodulin-like protein 7 n=1 Tax=Dioscorea cayennensis subsp. rotundata TaxID=55577 RepID=A0AB40AWV6_DIOCR|nr:calmodulin-like protein 7 [Dioscorea cayenensis subsp. rotundata]
MPSLLLRVSLILHLIHTMLNYLPDKLRSLLKSFWFSAKHEDECKTTVQKNGKAVDQFELSRVFEMFDHDGDGRISRKELHESLDNLGIFISEEDLSVMIEKIDVNEDGCVDMEEFGELYKSIVGGGGREEVEEDVKEAFDVFDVNGDGYISVEELRSVLSSLGLRQGWTKEDVKGMIGKVDEDGDGRVSFEEFKVMMKSGGFVGSL